MNVYGSARLTKDPEIVVSKSKGTHICSGRLIWDQGFNDNKKTVIIQYVSFGKTADAMNKFLVKGSKIFLNNAELSQNRWTDNKQVEHWDPEILIWAFEFAEPRKHSDDRAAHDGANDREKDKKDNATVEKNASTDPAPASDRKEGMDDMTWDNNEDDVPF